MINLLLYYIVLPIILATLVIRFLKKYGRDPVAPEIREFYARDPIEPKWFRVIAVTGKLGEPQIQLSKVGDYEEQDDAVDAAYQKRAFSPETTSVFVLNDRGEVLREV